MIDNDAYSWSEPRVQSEIESLLPEGWKFHFEVHPSGYWVARFLDETGSLVWSDTFPASNVLLLNAYGWIALRKTPRVTGTWGKRRDLTVSEVNADALRRARVPDPEDLNPSEVSAVYEGKRSK